MINNNMLIKSYFLLSHQDVKLLRIFNYYRLTLAFILLIPYFNETSQTVINIASPILFSKIAWFYLLSALILIPILHKAIEPSNKQIVMLIVADIAALSLMIYASGGINSGLGNLITFSVAAGSLLVYGRFAIFYAALASILVLSLEIYHSTIVTTPANHLFQAGILGIIYFGAAYFIKHVSMRAQKSEQLANERAGNIKQLEELNQLIIQRMRTGVIVCSEKGSIRMMNQAASRLFAGNGALKFGHTLPKPLIERLTQWHNHPMKRTHPFKLQPDNQEIQANFAAFENNLGSDVLIFLEDTSQTIQQAQQLKLASLGKLTANIAHEIRNPLGAISHASQLLSESNDIKDTDHRLNNIIQQHTRRLNKTVENILQLSRRNASHPETITLKTWLHDFVAEYHYPGATKAQFSIEIIPEDLKIQIDSTQFNQVISNLCSNGLRYSEAHTNTAAIQFKGSIKTESGLPYLEIINKGPAITTLVKQHLFEPFYTTERTGTGLGLHISRELCEANNVRLIYNDTYKNGCCFSLIFPHHKKLAL